MSALRNEIVRSVHHWTEELFSFRTSRDKGFRFASGQFTMIGLKIDGKPLLRAYSIASAHYEDELEFFSIKVPDGKLTSRLKDLAPGDRGAGGRQGHRDAAARQPDAGPQPLSAGHRHRPRAVPVDRARPGGLRAFREGDPGPWLPPGADLAYRSKLARELPADEILGDMVRDKLVYYPTITREPFKNRGRITDLIASGTLASDVGLPPIGRQDDRFMLCGSCRCWPTSVPCSKARASAKAARRCPASSWSRRRSSSNPHLAVRRISRRSA